MAKVIVSRQSRSTLLISISHEYGLRHTGLYRRTEVLHGAPDETSRRDEKVRDPRRDAETFWAETETRPETHTSETETRPRR